ncbi:hypothetical protein [Longimicrobium sp.]|uniref:hypothetical protein n=1 Tax=Longimicrobium sp. TaxID=2029185 RepID=UPI002BC7CC8F|nr:hypothetical protein [Longimicrobium sp.]HSU13990.1 hypothetical protein [Longimicrobium sp.]
MKRMIRLAALACTLASGAVLARPTPARATMSPSPFAVLSCCSDTTRALRCCYWTGCYINGSGCYKIG